MTITFISLISLFLYRFILIAIDINNIITLVTTVITGIPKVLMAFIIVSSVLESLLISDIIDTGTVDTTIPIIVINNLPLFIPNFKTKGIITDIDSIAEVILVGNNKFNEISCDEVIFIDKGEIILTAEADELRNREDASIDEIFRRMFRC